MGRSFTFITAIRMFGPNHTQWRSQHRILGGFCGGKILRQITVFCLGYRLSKHKLTRHAKKTLGGNLLLAAPVAIRVETVNEKRRQQCPVTLPLTSTPSLLTFDLNLFTSSRSLARCFVIAESSNSSISLIRSSRALLSRSERFSFSSESFNWFQTFKSDVDASVTTARIFCSQASRNGWIVCFAFYSNSTGLFKMSPTASHMPWNGRHTENVASGMHANAHTTEWNAKSFGFTSIIAWPRDHAKCLMVNQAFLGRFGKWSLKI